MCVSIKHQHNDIKDGDSFHCQEDRERFFCVIFETHCSDLRPPRYEKGEKQNFVENEISVHFVNRNLILSRYFGIFTEIWILWKILLTEIDNCSNFCNHFHKYPVQSRSTSPVNNFFLWLHNFLSLSRDILYATQNLGNKFFRKSLKVFLMLIESKHFIPCTWLIFSQVPG